MNTLYQASAEREQNSAMKGDYLVQHDRTLRKHWEVGTLHGTKETGHKELCCLVVFIQNAPSR